MKSFDDYYWHQFDVLNKDTQLARQFGQDVWDYKQAEIDELQNKLKGAVKTNEMLVAYKNELLDEIESIVKGQNND